MRHIYRAVTSIVLRENAGVVESVDTRDSKSRAARHGSSSLPSGTTYIRPPCNSMGVLCMLTEGDLNLYGVGIKSKLLYFLSVAKRRRLGKATEKAS
jgi:hypothetical protein